MYSLSVIFLLICVIFSAWGEKLSRRLWTSDNSFALPRLGFGTAGLGDNTGLSVCEALKNNIDLIDTAQASEWYNEFQVGLGITVCRQSGEISSQKDITIVTKVHPRNYDFYSMLQHVAASRRSLMVAHAASKPLDVVLLHAPFCWEGHCNDAELQHDWREGWKNLEKMKQLGHVAAIGVSNFNIEQLQELLLFATVPVSVVQNWMDPFHQDKDVRSFCKKNDILYMAYSSLGTQWEHMFPNRRIVQDNLELQQMAKRLKTSVPVVVISWLIQEDVVAIPRSSSAEHIKEFSDAFRSDRSSLRGILSYDDMNIIRQLDGRYGSPW